MKQRPIDHPRHDGMHYAARAEKAGCKVQFPTPKTIIVFSPDGKRAARFPAKITDAGTETLIRKFLKSIGVLLLLVLAAAWVLSAV